MELADYIKPLRRWWWLVLIPGLLAGISSYWVESNRPPLYTTRTTLIVGSTISLPNPTDADFRLARQLASLYGDIVQREPAREAAMENLGLTRLPAYVVHIPVDSQLIEIIVTDTHPQRAQAVANELARQLIERSPTEESIEGQERQSFIQGQLAYLQENITETQQEITAKQDELAEMVSAEQIAEAQSDLQALQSKLGSLQTIYASFLDSTNPDAVNTISVVESAALPRSPNEPAANLYLMVVVAAVLGLGLGSSAAYLLEHMDSSIEDEEAVERIIRRPVIGRIGRLPTRRWRKSQAAEVGLVIDDPISPHAEAFRTLKTNLDFAGIDQDVRSLLIASPGPGDGKTTIAVNLALTLARSGAEVLLLDADLRRPHVHRLLQLDNSIGLSDLVLDKKKVADVQQQRGEESLRIIPGGKPPPNPTDILTSQRMDSLLRAFESDADVVVIDCPPLMLADASVLASKVDGVVIVIRPGHTEEKAAKATREQLDRVGARVLGVVLNRVSEVDPFTVDSYMARYIPSGLEQTGSNGRLPRTLTALKEWAGQGWDRLRNRQPIE